MGALSSAMAASSGPSKSSPETRYWGPGINRALSYKLLTTAGLHCTLAVTLKAIAQSVGIPTIGLTVSTEACHLDAAWIVMERACTDVMNSLTLYTVAISPISPLCLLPAVASCSATVGPVEVSTSTGRAAANKWQRTTAITESIHVCSSRPLSCSKRFYL